MCFPCVQINIAMNFRKCFHSTCFSWRSQFLWLSLPPTPGTLSQGHIRHITWNSSFSASLYPGIPLTAHILCYPLSSFCVPTTPVLWSLRGSDCSISLLPSFLLLSGLDLMAHGFSLFLHLLSHSLFSTTLTGKLHPWINTTIHLSYTWTTGKAHIPRELLSYAAITFSLNWELSYMPLSFHRSHNTFLFHSPKSLLLYGLQISLGTISSFSFRGWQVFLILQLMKTNSK